MIIILNEGEDVYYETLHFAEAVLYVDKDKNVRVFKSRLYPEKKIQYSDMQDFIWKHLKL